MTKATSKPIVKKKPKAKPVQADAVSVPKKTHAHRLDEIGIDAICERVRANESQASIARSLNMTEMSLCNWIHGDDIRSARIYSARTDSSFTCESMALEALMDIDDNATQAAVTRQREIAHHYRWSAKVRNPRSFGDKVELSGNPDSPLVIIKDFSGTK